jgi:predicted TIM-barrel fold metal-dependent hydrolase
MTYAPEIDLDAVSAIDVHVHVEQDGHGHLSLDDELMDASAAYFRGVENRSPTVADIAQTYRGLGMAAVVFTVDAGTNTGHAPLSSEEITDAIAAEYADVLIPFGSVDPRRGAAAVEQARRLVTAHGVRGFKFHPSLQGFEPNDEAYYPLYEAIEELAVPALFHTGQNGIGAGLPGGRGIKLRYSNPLLLDDVAADFPGLTVILAHPSVPWQEEAISMATHKANVFIDLSGWSPKYFPPALVRAAKGRLRHKVLFGSDFPLISPERWIEDFRGLDVKDEVLPGILKDNAARLLGLAS